MNSLDYRPGRNNNQHDELDFSDVRAKVSLPYFFENFLGGEPKTVRGGLRFHICPFCGPSEQKSAKVVIKGDRWNCWGCSKHGDVIDAAAFLWGKTTFAAARELLGQDSGTLAKYSPPVVKPALAKDDSAMREFIQLLLDNKLVLPAEVYAYCAGRAISANTVKDAYSRDILVALPLNVEACKQYLLSVAGRDLLARTGIWPEDAKAPAVAFKPLLFITQDRTGFEARLLGLPSGDEPKGLWYGRMGSYWAWGSLRHKRALITEGVWDMLAAVDSGSKRYIRAVAGGNRWNAEMFEDMKGCDTVVGLDGDAPGLAAGGKMMEALAKAGATPSRYLPQGSAKDLNDERIMSDGHYCLLKFFKDGETKHFKKALLSLEGCSWWPAAWFGRHGSDVRISVELGSQSLVQTSHVEPLNRLLATFQAAGMRAEMEQGTPF